MTVPTFDYTPLTDELTPEQREQAFRKLVRSSVWLGVTAVLFLILLLLISVTNNHYEAAIIPGGLLFGFLVIGVVSSVVYLVVRYKQIVNTARLEAFAAINDMELEQHIEAPSYPGLIFTVGYDQSIDASIGTYRFGNPVELGNFRYVTGSGKSRTVHKAGYVRIGLPRRLPHMILDAQSNNFSRFFSSLPATFDRSQTLSLEGNFDKYFTLYAPKQYETDALYVFTPDVMDMLITHLSDYDVEIIDDELYLYTQQHFDLTDAATLQELFTLAATVSPEFNQQTDYYADEKVGNRQANVIAPGGQRLKQGVSWTTIVIGVCIFVINFADTGAELFKAGAGILVGGVAVLILLGAGIWFFRDKS